VEIDTRNFQLPAACSTFFQSRFVTINCPLRPYCFSALLQVTLGTVVYAVVSVAWNSGVDAGINCFQQPANQQRPALA